MDKISVLEVGYKYKLIGIEPGWHHVVHKDSGLGTAAVYDEYKNRMDLYTESGISTYRGRLDLYTKLPSEYKLVRVFE